MTWCVQWLDRATGKRQWCATKANRRPTEDAISDPTACGQFVILRSGSAEREPTCPECRERVTRRVTRKVKATWHENSSGGSRERAT